MTMNKLNAAIVSLLLIATVAGWGAPHWLAPETPSVAKLRGLSFSPYRDDQSPQADRHPDPLEIDRDLRLVKPIANQVRTYSMLDGLGDIPRLAQKHGMTVTAGAWIDGRGERNERELHGLVQAVRQSPNIKRALVGNETLLRNDVSVAELIRYIRRARLAVDVPVSTAETWHIWLKYPALAAEVDYITVHILPYWEGIPVVDSIAYIDMRMRQLRAAYPNKPIVLGEVGWPSQGRDRRQAQASPENQAWFLDAFARDAEKKGYDYFVIEAFDQPWKAGSEGAVGMYWGLFDGARNAKLALGPYAAPEPVWPKLAAWTILIAIGPLLLFLHAQRHMRPVGRAFVAVAIQAVAGFLVWAVHVATSEYQTTATIATWVLLSLFLVLLLVYLLVEAFDTADLMWRERRLRHFPSVAPNRDGPRPRVSIHVPIYNEPPQMVIETLRALRALDYPDYEILVIDNNTKDPAVWRPVEAYCAGLGDNVRFFHLDHCPGFKAGALNYLLAQTDPAAEIVAVIDSDYIVDPTWLDSLVPYFARPEVGLVQAPQDYRDGPENPFKTLCDWEYAGFFRMGMVQRNEHNAIIQHGTMTMIRRTALDAVGGWGEWCITEDAELGLKLFAAGWEAVYTPESYGRGLTPDSFAAYKSQRYRWAYGAVQIMKRHLDCLLTGAGTKLTGWQRWYFVAGWAPWLVDGLNLVFTGLALVWTLGLLVVPAYVDTPRTLLMAAPLALFAFKLAKTGYAYSARVGAGFGQSLGAVFAATALSHAISRAVIAGAFTSNRPFLRTPKCQNRPAIVQALAAALEECALLALLLAGAAGTWIMHRWERPESMLWVVCLLVAAVPYASALGMALVNALPSLGWARARLPVFASEAR